MTLSQRFTISVNNNGTACKMAIMIVAHSITPHQIALIFQRPGTRQQLPGRLTTFGPISYQHNDIVVQGIGISAPTREAQIVARQQQQTESGIIDSGMILARGIEFILVSKSEKMMFIVIGYTIIPSINKIVTITECAIVQFHCQTARDGAMVLAGGGFHPRQCRIRGFVGSNTMRLGSKPSAPHLRQDIQIAAFCFSEQSAGLTNVFFRLSPADIGLEKCYFQYSSSLMEGFPLKDTIWSMR